MQGARLLDELQFAFSKAANGHVIDLDKILLDQESSSLLRLEDIYAKTNGIIPPFRQSNFLLVFVKKGAGTRSIGHHNFKIVDNSIAIVPKRVIHGAMYTTSPVGYLITFNVDFFLEQAFSYKLLNSKRVLKTTLPPFMVLNDEQSDRVTAIFENIIEECNSGFEQNREMIALKVLELLILCDRFFSGNDKSDADVNSPLLEAFTDLVEENFTKHREVNFYANTLNTHPNNLNYIVRKTTGMTAKQTINNRVIIEAKYLLASTDLTVKEIASQLGFEDTNYFSSFFKKKQQVAPLIYRKQFA